MRSALSLTILGLALVGCGGQQQASETAPPAPARSTGPNPREEAARAAIMRMGGQFHKHVAIGTKGLRIDFGKNALQDSDMQELVSYLRELPVIDELDLSGTAISAVGLLELKEARNLRLVALPAYLLNHPAVREIRDVNPHFSIRGPL